MVAFYHIVKLCLLVTTIMLGKLKSLKIFHKLALHYELGKYGCPVNACGSQLGIVIWNHIFSSSPEKRHTLIHMCNAMEFIKIVHNENTIDSNDERFRSMYGVTYTQTHKLAYIEGVEIGNYEMFSNLYVGALNLTIIFTTCGIILQNNNCCFL